MVNCERQFLKSHNVLANFTALQTIFQAIKMAGIQRKTFLKRSKLQFHFFLYVLRPISIITCKPWQQISVSYILFKQKTFLEGI